MTGNLAERLKSYTSERNANFDSDEFLLEDGHSIYGEDLEIEKNDKHSDWNETFTGDKAKWCVVWTAAYQYWYGDNHGLKRPRQNTAMNWSLDIEVYYKNKKDYYDNLVDGVEDFFTQKKYGSPANNNYDKTYTAIFGDLIDGDKDYKKKNGIVSSGDAVKGFEITELEKGVFNSSSLNGLKKYLMEKYPSGVNGRSYTKDAMNNLFNYWTK